MRRPIFLVGFTLTAMALSAAPVPRTDAAVNVRTSGEAAAPAGRGRLEGIAMPCEFEVNGGQTAAEVDALVRCRGYVAFLSHGDAVIRTEREAFRLRLVGGRTDAKAQTKGPRPGASNYFVGSDEARWVTGAPHFGRVEYDDVLPGVRVAYRTHGRELAFDFELAPGADAAALRLQIEGARWLGPDAEGNLSIGLPGGGSARLSAPRAWQGDGALRRNVTVAFARGAGFDDVAFEVGEYDPAQPLVIDPSLTVATYLGGSSDDHPGSIRTDSSGAIYLTGQAYSADFPTTMGAFQTTKGETSTSVPDAFVTKLDSGGTTLVFSTFLGGSGSEFASDVAIDSSGAVYVGGSTSSTNFPLRNAFQTSSASGYLTKLAAGGGSLVWSTYYAHRTSVLGLATSGNIHCFNTSGRAFVFNSGGTSVLYSVSIGGFCPPNFSWTSMAVDPSGTVWLGGYIGTNGSASYAISGAYQLNHAGGSNDGWLVKLSTTGSEVYRSYLGGSGDDLIRTLALDSSGNLLIAGTTTSTNFPLANAYQSTNAAATDAFVVKMNSSATALTFSTYLGGSAADVPAGIIANPGGDVFVAGYTMSGNFPTFDAFQSTNGGNTDAFLTEFTSGGSLSRSTYLGGSGNDGAQGVAVGPLGRPLVAGSTQSSNFPITCSYQANLLGTSDVFLAGVATSTASFPDLSPLVLQGATVNRGYSAQLTITGGTAPLTWTLHAGTLPAGLSLSSGGVLSGTPTATGSASVFVKVTDSGNACAIREYRVTVNPQPSVPQTALPAWTETRAYSKPIPVIGGTGPYVWAATSGAVPAGLAVTTDGYVSGTPTAPGSYSFGLSVEDVHGATANGTDSLVINALPQITTTSLPEWTQLSPYLGVLAVSGGTPPFTWSVPSGTFPLDKALGATSGSLSGNTLLAGDYTFDAKLTDAAGAAATRTLTLHVNGHPTMTTAQLPRGAHGRPYAFGPATVGGTQPFRWSITAGRIPSGLGFGIDTGRFSGIPTASGRTIAGLQITDAAGAVAARSYSLTIAPFTDLSKSKVSESVFIPQEESNVDVVRFLELLAGTELDLSIKLSGTIASAVDLLLLDAAERPIDLTEWRSEKTTSITVKDFPVPRTGRYFVVVRPTPGFEGKLKLQVAASAITTWRGTGTLDPAGAALTMDFSAPPGSKLSIAAKASAGSLAVPTIGGVTDAQGAQLLVPAELKESKKSAVLKSKLPLTGGDYRLTIAARGGVAGPVEWTVSLKAPKGYRFELPDLAVGPP